MGRRLAFFWLAVPLWIAAGARRAPAEDLPAPPATWIRSETPAAAAPAPPLERRAWGPCLLRCDPCPARGPVEVRDEWLLAQPRLTLPAVAPDPLCCGEWEYRVATNRGNDFGWRQSGPAEAPIDRRFLIDGEHQTTEFVVRHQVTPRWGLQVRLPVQWRGAGFMDGSIDWFHELGETIGLRDNGRPLFRNDRFRVEGRDDAFNAISWSDEHGVGLGNVEVAAHFALRQPLRRSDWRVAVVGRVGVPTGTGPFETGSVDLGAQVVAARQLAPAWDLYGGVGGTWFSDTTTDGLEYEAWRAHAFLALEWRFTTAWSLLVQTDVASRLVRNLAEYPAEQWYVHLALRADLGAGWQLEGGFTENISDQQSTVDFGAFLGLSLRR